MSWLLGKARICTTNGANMLEHLERRRFGNAHIYTHTKKKKIQFLSGHVFCQIDPWAKHGARRGASAIHSKEISADGLCRFWICAVEEIGLTGPGPWGQLIRKASKRPKGRYVRYVRYVSYVRYVRYVKIRCPSSANHDSVIPNRNHRRTWRKEPKKERESK